MKKMLFAGLCMAALATSCSDNLNVDGAHSVELGATVTAEQSRAAFLSSGAFYWQKGDQIGVITKKGNDANTAFTPLTLSSGDGTGSATFKGMIVGELGNYAIYPYDENQRLDNGTLTYTFPSSYEYSKVDQTFFPFNYDGNSYNPAMLASIENNKISFKHLGGVFCISVESMPCTAGTLTLTTDESLCGKYTTTVGGTDTPELKSSSTVTENNNKVTIDFKGATKNKTGVFYIPCPTGTYKNATITFVESGSTSKKTIVAGKYVVDRKDLVKIELKTTTVTGETATEAKSAAEATTKLESADNVALTSEVGDNATIDIPKVTSTTAAKTLTLQNVKDGATFTVEDENTSTESATNSVKELTLSIPNTTADNAPSAVVNTPNTTVTLAANAGSANFNEVTASTAENTLVVSSGVTIKKLIVKKGNVRINKGAKVEAIELTDGKTSANLYYEIGATNLPSVDDTKIKKLGIIENGGNFYNALQNTGNYVLLKDVTFGGYGKTYENVSIDLNQHTLNVSSKIYPITSGDLTFTNGTINQTNSQSMVVYSNCSLTLDNVKYTGNGIMIYESSTNTKLTVKNSDIIVDNGNYAVTTNATAPVASNCTMTLEDSKFVSGTTAKDGTALLVNIPAKVTMKNCTFTSYCQAALLRGGTYEIENCTFTLNAEKTSTDTGNKWLTAWGEGNYCAYAALTIGNYDNKSYQYRTSVTFKESTNGNSKAVVTGTNVASFPAMHVCANTTDELGVTITGLKYVDFTQSKGTLTGPEYGTTNIKVDDAAATVNIPAATTSGNEKASARKK